MGSDALYGDYPYSMEEFLGSSPFFGNGNGFLLDPDFMPSPANAELLNFDSVPSPGGGSSDGEYSSDDGKASNPILKFIGEMLMEEEDLEDKPCMLQDSLALQAAEKSLYDIIGQDYHPMYPFPDQFQDLNGSNQAILAPPSRDPDPYPGHNSPNGSRLKKNHQREEDEIDDSEARSNKQSAVSVSSDEIDLKMFDKVLLCGGGDESGTCFFHQTEPESRHNTHQNPKKPAGKRRGKKNGPAAAKGGGEMVDLWTLLTQCSQSVASNDQRTSHDLLNQIRQHSSPHGDGLQRTAHYFANALEARLAGARTPAYSPLVSNNTSAAEILKAYQVYVTACPFKRMSHFYANKMIMKQAETATSLHIIDFGILYGYQWPCLIQRLSKRPGGPPRIRITGIELPQPGFRPAERVEETGRRLENYCKRFNVPFEYEVIAQKWETIKYEDLKIDRDDMIIVNCLYRLKNIPDETVAANSPRDAVLGLIRSIKPDLFVHGVVNGTYNAPFFVTRFREALFHFSALFDMFEVNIPREEEQRMLFEREVFAKDVMNAIACEGMERVERPETYKQWQVRNIRAGLRPVPLERELCHTMKERVRSGYHKDFVIHEDGNWVVQGWKGRLIYAISCWRAA